MLKGNGTQESQFQDGKLQFLEKKIKKPVWENPELLANKEDKFDYTTADAKKFLYQDLL